MGNDQCPRAASSCLCPSLPTNPLVRSCALQRSVHRSKQTVYEPIIAKMIEYSKICQKNLKSMEKFFAALSIPIISKEKIVEFGSPKYIMWMVMKVFGVFMIMKPIHSFDWLFHSTRPRPRKTRFFKDFLFLIVFWSKLLDPKLLIDYVVCFRGLLLDIIESKYRARIPYQHLKIHPTLPIFMIRIRTHFLKIFGEKSFRCFVN